MSIDLEHDLAERIENPAWDFIKNIPHDSLFGDGGRFSPASWSATGDDFIGYRDLVTRRWSWAVPDPDAVAFVVESLNGRPVVELGAGSGYWAWLLRQSGIDVNAYDRSPIGHEKSWFKGIKSLRYEPPSLPEGWPTEPEEFYPVTEGSVEVLDLPENQDRVLFLCWPDYSSDFAYQAVRRFRGQQIVYIGEGPGGCCGNSDFWRLLAGQCDCWGDEHNELCDPSITQEWERIGAHPIVQFAGLHDYIDLYRRIV